MKFIGSILIILLFSSARPVSNISPQFAFPKMDSALVNLWISCKEKNEDSAHLFINRLLAIWDDSKIKMSAQRIDHLDMASVIHEIDILIKEIDFHINLSDFDVAELYTFHILWQFKDIRKNLTSDQYSLDELIETYEIYQEVKCIVNDEMMGLYEWREFIAVVDQLKKEIKRYKSITKNELDNDFPLVKSPVHTDKINDLKKQLRAFERSLDSALRTDFIEPCDQIEPAIIELFKSYTQLLITS